MTKMRDDIITAANTLEAAASLIENGGWANGDAAEATDADGKIVSVSALSATNFTPYGAIKRAGRNLPLDGWVHAVSWLKLYVKQAYPKGDTINPSLYEWNNLPGQTKEKVIVDMRAAAKRCRDNAETHN